MAITTEAADHALRVEIRVTASGTVGQGTALTAPEEN
jgi:hypothetical protein